MIGGAFAKLGLKLLGEGAIKLFVESGVEELGESAAARGAARLACCFVAGTLIDTETGLRPIEDIRVGDQVQSRNPATGVTALKTVTGLVHRHDREIYVVKLAVKSPSRGEHIATFKTTDDHPWRSASGEWLHTVELTPGALLLRAEGQPARVVSVVNSGKTAPTFNLEVADFHTYFVGKDKIWVHNACFGRFKSAQKWAGQLLKRGWSPGQVDEAIASGRKFPAPNNINPANGATRFVHPTTGQSVVIDNVTGEVIHVGGPGFRY